MPFINTFQHQKPRLFKNIDDMIDTERLRNYSRFKKTEETWQLKASSWIGEKWLYRTFWGNEER